MEHLSHASVCAWMEQRFGTVKKAFRELDANKDGAVDMEEMHDRLRQEQTRLGIHNDDLATLMRWCGRNRGCVDACFDQDSGFGFPASI
jgi:Ca2+-binding EF-hand superfamily protein